MPTEQPMHELDRYLDDVLPPAERAAFEQRLRTDEALRFEVECQRAIDGSLRRLFVVSAPARGRARSITLNGAASEQRGAQVNPRSPFRLWKPLAAAAIIAAGLAGAWLAWLQFQPMQPETIEAPTFVKLTPDRLYESELVDFTPSWKCSNDEEFASAVRVKLNQPLLLKPAPQVEALGWNYSNIISRNTMVLLATADEAKIVVIIDRAEADQGLAMSPQAEGLHLHKRVIDDLVLYEVSPLDQPRLLDQFYNPER